MGFAYILFTIWESCGKPRCEQITLRTIQFPTSSLTHSTAPVSINKLHWCCLSQLSLCAHISMPIAVSLVAGLFYTMFFSDRDYTPIRNTTLKITSGECSSFTLDLPKGKHKIKVDTSLMPPDCAANRTLE